MSIRFIVALLYPRRRFLTPVWDSRDHGVPDSISLQFGEVGMSQGLSITREDHTATEFRHAASRCRDSAAARRMLALALVKEGRSRTDAAQSCGMDRQTLRDWVHRYNEAGLSGLSDKRGRTGPKPLLSPEQEAEFATLVRKGPDPEKDGVVRWRRKDLACVIKARFDVIIAERTVGDLLRRLGFSHVSPRPRHPKADAAAQASFGRRSAPS